MLSTKTIPCKTDCMFRVVVLSVRWTSAPVSYIMLTVTDFLRVLSCIWLHSSSHELWPASLYLLKKSAPIVWFRSHHVYLCKWCVKGDVLCKVPVPHCFSLTWHDVWLVANWKWEFLRFHSTMAFLLLCLAAHQTLWVV